MRKIIMSFSIAVLLGFFTVASAQLPPKVIADKYRIQLEQLLEKKRYKAALKRVKKIILLQKKHSLTLSHEFYFKDTIKKLLEKKRYTNLLSIMEEIILLHKEHSLTLPNEFHFRYAQVAFSTGLFQTAVDAAKKYLATAGKKGTFYKEALGLLNKAEQAKQIIPIEPEMVVIPSGYFLQRDEYSVYIYSFALSKYEVTFEEYNLFTDATGRKRVSDNDQDLDRFPVINITRKDAVAYTVWLSEQTGKSYRLPSEDEWEYAARAGSTGIYGWWSDDIDNREESSDWEGTLPVGSFSANKWGLHDMIYNVSEWTQHSSCGSSWIEVPRPLTAGPFCVLYSSKRRQYNIGFRVARSF